MGLITEGRKQEMTTTISNKDSAVYFSNPFARLRSGAIFVDGERQLANDPSLFIPVGEEL
jgi:hypothetical protein